jgi:hypothetical protein
MAQSTRTEQVVGTDTGYDEHHFGTDHLLPIMEGRTVRGAAVSIASHGLKLSISLVATGIMARLLTPDRFVGALSHSRQEV